MITLYAFVEDVPQILPTVPPGQLFYPWPSPQEVFRLHPLCPQVGHISNLPGKLDTFCSQHKSG